MRGYCAVVVMATALTLAAQNAQAEDGFELCNRTKLVVSYAKALNTANSDKKEKARITSEGWFTLAPGACDILYPGALQFRYYLIYAEAKASNRKWSGKLQICAENGAFKITGETCALNRNHRLFFSIDTGDSDHYTYDLE